MNATSNSPVRVSIAVRAWNEEQVIRRALESLFQQSLFAELSRRNECCEVLCIPNGCTDRTAEVAEAVFAEQRQSHPHAGAFRCRVENMIEAGRNNTWNAYVHQFADRGAEFVFLMDADIVFDRETTLFKMYEALLNNPEAHVASDRAVKEIAFKKKKTLRDRLSLATSDMTGTITAQICGQLYGIRSEIARRIWMPKDLGAPDDGFIKALVCTDFFTRELNPRRVIMPENASHVFNAYTSVAEMLNNQKRQMAGQATVHILIEYVKQLPLAERINPAPVIRYNEENDPQWMRRRLDAHLREARFFWQLFPNALSYRIRRWWRMSGLKRLTHFPAAAAGFAVTLMACARAYYHFKHGQVHYWPKASRPEIELARSSGSATAQS